MMAKEKTNGRCEDSKRTRSSNSNNSNKAGRGEKNYGKVTSPWDQIYSDSRTWWIIPLVLNAWAHRRQTTGAWPQLGSGLGHKSQEIDE